jgi:hypothetical protein
MKKIPVSVELLKRIGRLADDVAAYEECTCDSPGCAGTCLYSLASGIQDDLVKLLGEQANAEQKADRK